jgi:sulfate adenylyltransferase subunit 1
VKELKYKIDINTLHKLKEDREVRLNDIARVSLQTSAPLHFDRYRRNRSTGSFILIDDQTSNTVAAGIIVG